MREIIGDDFRLIFKITTILQAKSQSFRQVFESKGRCWVFICTYQIQTIDYIYLIQVKSLKMEYFKPQKKYSKISPALKCCFLQCLYLKGMTIKDAAVRCKLNYSTAKVIIRDLNQIQRSYVKKLIKTKEHNLKKEGNLVLKECSYKTLCREQKPNIQGSEGNETSNSYPVVACPVVQVISRVAFDFFLSFAKSQ